MATYESQVIDYEVTEDGVFYDIAENASDNEGEESDPLASASEDDQDQKAREEIFGASIDDLLAENRRRGRRKKRRLIGYTGSSKRSRGTDVPSYLLPLMGSATLAFMLKRYDEAEESLKRIIDASPKAVAPYRTLGLIYEEREQKEKALEIYMQAAEIDRNDRHLWKRNAALWEEAGNPEKAIYCLTQALKGTYGGDEDALRGRGQLYLSLKKYRKAALSFIKLAKLVPEDLEVAKMVIFVYRKVGQAERAVAPVEGMMRDCEMNAFGCRASAKAKYDTVIPELIQLLVELRFLEKKYYEAKMLLSRLQDRNSGIGRPMTFVQRLMLAICQHRLGYPKLAEATFKEFMSSPTMISKHRMLLWQVADACRESGKFVTGVRAYTLLLDLNDIDYRAEVFLQRASCYKAIGNLPAVKADLESVLEIKPRHVEASLRIQEFLPPKTESSRRRRRGDGSYGMNASSHITPAEKQEALAVLSYANTAFEQGDFNRYLMLVFVALETALLLDVSSIDDHRENQEDECDVEDDKDEDSSDGEDGEDAEQRCKEQRNLVDTGEKKSLWSPEKLSKAEKTRLHTLGANLMRILIDDAFVDVGEKIVVSFQAVGELALAHPILRTFGSLNHLRVKGSKQLRRRLKMLGLVTSTAAGDIPYGYESARTMLLEHPDDSDVAFAYSVVEQLWGVETDSQRIRSFRFLARLANKNRESICLAFLTGNVSSRGGLNIRRYTVGIYLRALRLAPHNPLICLCLAIQVLYVAMGRRVTNRNEMMMYALGFLNDYRRNRRLREGEIQRGLLEMEGDYNVARAMHQLGLLHMAADLYQRVLTCGYAGCEDEVPMWGDLRRDAAYNLMQIYERSGNSEMAAAICRKFLMF